MSRRQLIAAAVAAIVVGCAGQMARPVGDGPDEDDAHDGLAALGRRFQLLRQRRNARKPGTPDHEMDGVSGELHLVMVELGQRLGVAGTPAARVAEVMGEPDNRGPSFDHRALQWSYQWRGYHDYLYFELTADRVTGAGWSLAAD